MPRKYIRKNPGNGGELTPLEIEIMVLVEQGLLYKEIADMFNMTVAGFSSRIRRIYNKINVRNRGEAGHLFRGD